MKHKKFLLIPVLIFLYIFFINWLVESATLVPSEQQTTGEGPMHIGISTGVSVTVTRPYLFGLLELPVYTGALGDISSLHTTFFIFIVILTIAFAIMDWRKKERRKSYEYKVV
jgi:F0F1-type ATP synthase membrane subunit a